MKQPPIIVIVNKKPYTFSANDTEVIHSIPSADRQQLITLLEAIKQQENQSQASVQQAAAMVSATSTLAANRVRLDLNKNLIAKPWSDHNCF